MERPKLSAKAVSFTDDFIDDVSGVTLLKKSDVLCPLCPAAFIRYVDLDNHMTKSHRAGKSAGSNSPGALFDDDSAMPSMFADEPQFDSAWLDGMGQEEIFAAEMDYGPTDDGWAEDEANILLLARDPVDIEQPVIDPALQAP